MTTVKHFKSVEQLWDLPKMEPCLKGHCSVPAAVLREQYLVRLCVPGVSLERGMLQASLWECRKGREK